jgi:hypothetical protein
MRPITLSSKTGILYDSWWVEESEAQEWQTSGVRSGVESMAKNIAPGC